MVSDVKVAAVLSVDVDVAGVVDCSLQSMLEWPVVLAGRRSWQSGEEILKAGCIGGGLSCRSLSSLSSLSCCGCRLLETVLVTVSGGGVSGLCVLDVELPAQWVEGGGVGLPVLGVPLLRGVGLLERLLGGVVSRLRVWRVGNFRLCVCSSLGTSAEMISLSVEAGRELEDLVPVLGLLDLKREESVMDGEPGQGDGAESSGVGPGQRQEDVAQVMILGDDDPVEGDQVA